MDSTSWPRVAVVGAGAVGGYFSGMLARAGARVMLIGRPGHVDVWKRDGLFLDSVPGHVKHAGRSSTARDLARGARTGIDARNGYVVRRGALPTRRPVGPYRGFSNALKAHVGRHPDDHDRLLPERCLVLRRDLFDTPIVTRCLVVNDLQHA